MKTHSGIVVHLLVVYYARMTLSDEDHSAQRERRKRELHSASSLEEVLRLTDSPDWKLWKCRLKLKHLPPSPNCELYRSSPAGSHRPTRFAAASYSWEIGQEITQEILQVNLQTYGSVQHSRDEVVSDALNFILGLISLVQFLWFCQNRTLRVHSHNLSEAQHSKHIC
ncbi:hypothetical protein AAFF_G00014450 [Aldrovandia affinis]|uniref:Uncharacterized protein n=1 Tax=Aldrovandia affinis TaxID=143900 RepID=A0AAD7VY76_9TELE|nr:hypothetical protein AAFF_G00014450 [Aldrovandia affinis]